MKLQDIYDQLAYGELRMLNLGSGNLDSEEDGFPKESFKKILPTIQLGLTELYKKFLLREGHMTVPLVEGQVTYVLTAKKDAPNDFRDDLFKIERIKGIWYGEEYEIPLNRISNKAAIRTTSHNTMLVPNNEDYAPWLKETTQLNIAYRANHPQININLANSAPLATEIDLPMTHLQALLYFIASRLHNPIGMQDQYHEGNNFAAKYENELVQLQMLNYEIDDDADEDRVRQQGWV